jgi:hypothetical protein
MIGSLTICNRLELTGSCYVYRSGIEDLILITEWVNIPDGRSVDQIREKTYFMGQLVATCIELLRDNGVSKMSHHHPFLVGQAWLLNKN